MNILWITQQLPSEAAALLGGESDLKGTGGWILGMAGEIIKREDIALAIVSTSPKVKELVELQGERIRYFIVPPAKKVDDSGMRECFVRVRDTFRPDVVHIHGTEYMPSLAWVKACGAERTVVSLQGIMTSCAAHFYGGMSQWDIIRNVTPRDLIKETTMGKARRFARIGVMERELLRNVGHAIGRTQWDRTQLWAINPDAHYHFCNEILRPEFYKGDVWEFGNCEKYTIFVNQAAMPYKGFHQVVKALPLIARHYPGVRVRVAGFDIVDPSRKRRVMRTGYGRYLIRLMKELDVYKYVKFIGPQNADGMIREMLKANVFVLPSSIENSPNALGEAQMLGVPLVASRVGGVADMIPNEQCGRMYRFSDTEELARTVCEALESAASVDNSMMRRVAGQRHDRERNVETLVRIYKEMSE